MSIGGGPCSIVARLFHFTHFLSFFISYFLPIALLILLHLLLETLRALNTMVKIASGREVERQSHCGCWGCPEGVQVLPFPCSSPSET